MKVSCRCQVRACCGFTMHFNNPDLLSIVNCWPSPSNDGTCEVSIEYELENESVTLYDVVISIPLP